MTSLSIPRMPPAGNPSVPLLARQGPWPCSGGLHRLCAVRSGRAGRARSTPPSAWSAPCLSHRIPQVVLPLSWLLLRPHLLTRGAAPSARRRAVRGRHSLGISAAERKEVTMGKRA
jgi:hypothetical protein